MTAPSQTDEDLDALAAQWLVRAMSPEVGDEDLVALSRWLEASPDHLAAYDRAEAVWDEAVHLPPAARGPGDPGVVVPFAAKRPAPRPAPRRVWLYGALAAAGIAAAAILVFPHARPAGPVWQSYQTAKGERRAVQLADGSRLQLNSDTRVRVDLSGAGRRFELDRGEVALAVVHDAARPLTLVAGDVAVSDIGTQFDVYRSDAGVRIMVGEGEVAVTAANRPADRVALTAGRQAGYDPVHGLGPAAAADVDTALAWRQGRAVYRDVPLASVVADLNRYVDKPLVVHGALGHLKVNAVLSLESEAKIVEALEAFLPVRAVDTPGGLELRRK